MTIDRRFLIAAGCALLLSGCETGFRDMKGDVTTFGEANRQTMMAQVVDPDPQYDKPMETSAEHTGQAADRYHKDKVKKPERVRSTSATGGGS
jgi:hypothetical protein